MVEKFALELTKLKANRASGYEAAKSLIEQKIKALQPAPNTNTRQPLTQLRNILSSHRHDFYGREINKNFTEKISNLEIGRAHV